MHLQDPKRVLLDRLQRLERPPISQSRHPDGNRLCGRHEAGPDVNIVVGCSNSGDIICTPWARAKRTSMAGLG